MEELGRANKRLKTVSDDYERDFKAQIAKLDREEESLKERLKILDEKKAETARANGNENATDDDLVEINAGGKIIAAKRSTLTQHKGTRFEALFSGRWDKKLQRDSQGRIFLDVDSVCFQAIVDYLAEMAISSEDDPPNPPSVGDEHKHILSQQLKLFGLSLPTIPDSTIITKAKYGNCIHRWLGENDADGELTLLYRGSRDGLSNGAFHSKCDNKGCTLTVVETADGLVVGGYSNTPWTKGESSSNDGYERADKAFLFVLSGDNIPSPYKMKLINANDKSAVLHSDECGPAFGEDLPSIDGDLRVYDGCISLDVGGTYEDAGCLSSDRIEMKIREMEVFQVNEAPSLGTGAMCEHVNRFADDVNKAIDAKQESLVKAKAEILSLEESFKDEHNFISTFANGSDKDVVTLNVCGTIMTTKRSTLQAVEDSVLAQQFDDSKWTEKGLGNYSRVKEWTPDEVSAWANDIEGIQEDVGSILKDNKINGSELLALEKDGLMMLGIERTGTLCLLLKEIKMLKQASSDVVTLIEHSPYCFGKILEFLRWKQLHSPRLVDEAALPHVCVAQKSRFEKVVRYYFPGESAKIILG